MKKNNVRIKSNITMADKVNAIEGIASSYFTNGEYTPYYAEMGEIIAIVTYFMEGLEFDEDESIYHSVISDKEVMDKINMFYNNMFNVGEVMTYVQEQVNDKVDFIKQQMIYSYDDMNKIIEACNVVIDSFENFSKLNLTQISKEDMETGMKIMRQITDKGFNLDDLSDVIKNAVGFNMDKATAEIIDSKNEEIRELKKYKTLWESRNTTNPNSSKNVIHKKNELANKNK